MSLSRTEIELLITAKNNGQAAFSQLNDQVTKVTGATQQANTQMDQFGGKVEKGGVAAQAAGVAVGMLAERLARGLVSAFQDSIQAANKLDAGLVGLSSVANAFGQDAGKAQSAAKALAADGLMSVGDAASGLKNLLAAGFGLDQAVTLMHRFKDSAAFGKQGALEFGQAIVGATEGIKNGNSALVDNAGVTKNLSNILVEAGFSAQDLSKASSDVNVRMAIFRGILKETNPQLGDTERLLKTAAGQQAVFNSQVDIAQQRVGKALQPALGALMEALTPLVKVVGDNADTFVRLGGVIATIVVPIAAAKAAATLGLTPALTGLTAATTGLIGAMTAGGGISTFKDFRAGIQLAGESAGLTTKSLGGLGTAGALAAAAFVGWQFGRWIADVTGADKAIQNFTADLLGYNAALKNQTTGAVQDTINRAIREGAAATITYADAIKYNTAVTQIKIAQHDKSLAAQRLAIDAELQLGRITVETANARKTAIDDEEKAQQVLASRARLTDVQANLEKKYRDEIKATHYTEAELLKALKTNEQGFEAYAKQVNLSDSTVKKLKDTLKAQEDQQKKNTETTKKHTEEQKKFNTELETTAGVISGDTLLKRLADLNKLLDAAGQISTPALATAVRNLWPEFEKLNQQAKDAGFVTTIVDDAFKRAAVSAGVFVDHVRDLRNVQLQIPDAARPVNAALVLQAEKAEQVNRAYTYFGISTPEQLRKVAVAAQQNYAILSASGTATTQELKAAYQAMIDAQNAATRTVPTIWQTEVFPGIKRVVETLDTAVKGTFAQMLLGAKGFQDGFIDIWKSIKASVVNILNEILSAFLGNFLKGILGALSGQQGAMSKALGGVFGGGLTTVGAGGQGGAAGGGNLLGGLGLAGMSQGALATLLNVGFAGGAGAGLGFLGKKMFGGSGAGAGIFGGVTGGLLGGLAFGGPIGALVGGGIGLISGLLGKSKGEKANDARDQFVSTFGGSGTGSGSGFANLAGQLHAIDGGDALFNRLERAKSEKEVAVAVDAVTTALAKQAKQEADTAKAATDAAAAAEDAATRKQLAIDAVASKYADSLKALQAESKKLGDAIAAEAPEDEIGLEERANRARLQQVQAESDAIQKKIADEQQAAGDAFDAMEAEAKTKHDALQQFYDRNPLHIPYDLYEQGGVTGGRPGPPVEGQAAGGVMASRPGLVLFGEGGEPEVGGPADFFQRIFQSLGVTGDPATKGGRTDDTPPLAVTFNVAAGADAAAFRKAGAEIVEAFTDIVRRGGTARTRLQQALGVG